MKFSFLTCLWLWPYLPVLAIPVIDKVAADGGADGGSGESGGRGDTGSGSSSSGSSSFSTSSNVGGRTTTGIGEPPTYGDRQYYRGGATVPYRSGSRSPSGIVPLAVGVVAGGGIAELAFWPGRWYHAIYFYPYPRPYSYYNQSSGKNETKAVACGCDKTVECSCDDNYNSTYITSLIGSGLYAALNRTTLTVGNVNGTITLLINGTLANGTTASGGSASLSASGELGTLLQRTWWPPVLALVLTLIL